MSDSLPLSALLSQALVAFTIEFDNEAERRLPHSTTHGTEKGVGGPWLVSMAMWWNCMRYVTEDGITVRELERRARTPTNLDGMRRWGYIRIDPDTAGLRSKKPRRDAVLRPTMAGRWAQDVWRPLSRAIETRWEDRFGKDTVETLRSLLRTLAGGLDPRLPDCMPILRYGLAMPKAETDVQRSEDSVHLELPSLLARPLVAFALEFERESGVSLAICANVLRVVADNAIRVRDLPRLSGVSKEAIAMASGFLEKRGYVVVRLQKPGTKVKMMALTTKGSLALQSFLELSGVIEARWQERFGGDTIRELREALERLGAGPRERRSRLFEGLKPHPENWRASLPTPETLPHFPMVLHRGGYPDGS